VASAVGGLLLVLLTPIFGADSKKTRRLQLWRHRKLEPTHSSTSLKMAIRRCSSRGLAAAALSLLAGLDRLSCAGAMLSPLVGQARGRNHAAVAPAQLDEPGGEGALLRPDADEGAAATPAPLPAALAAVEEQPVEASLAAMAKCADFRVSGPWVALKCLQREVQSGLALVERQAPPTDSLEKALQEPIEALKRGSPASFAGAAIFCTGVVFFILTLKDVHRFVMLLAQSSNKKNRCESASDDEFLQKMPDAERKAGGREENSLEVTPAPPQQWSVLAIIALTGYRFYTGFLSATWLPYLLAMEGEDLWKEKQSMFMGIAKLIYGGTILLNPVFGLIGDQAVSLSHGVGRRLFVRIGVTLAALGIYICVLSARERDFLSFLSGILVWRLGEAMNDVTTEALVPEMVPQEQYQTASGIKACSFLLGGLVGYTILMVFSDLHYTWLYYAYPIGMFVCAVPSLYLLDKDHPVSQKRQHENSDEESFLQSLVKAYLVPVAYRGGFPRACLAVFVFGLGTAPMFFLLLIVRDLVGITDPVVMQQHFSCGSIVFFCAAALSSCIVAIMDPKKAKQRALNAAQSSPSQASEAGAAPSPVTVATTAEILDQRGRLLVVSMLVFGAIVFLIPGLALLQERESRDHAYYTITAFFGAAFGTSFSLFQDLTWQILPQEVNFANAMGFSVMSRLLGIGLGNFLCGIFLDLSYESGPDGSVSYKPLGYVVMCTFSGLCVLCSTAIASSAIAQAKEVDEEEHFGKKAVAA